MPPRTANPQSTPSGGAKTRAKPGTGDQSDRDPKPSKTPSAGRYSPPRTRSKTPSPSKVKRCRSPTSEKEESPKPSGRAGPEARSSSSKDPVEKFDEVEEVYQRAKKDLSDFQAGREVQNPLYKGLSPRTKLAKIESAIKAAEDRFVYLYDLHGPKDESSRNASSSERELAAPSRRRTRFGPG
jgi:hypothetical protein